MDGEPTMSYRQHIAGRAKFGLNYLQFEDALMIYQTVGRSEFTTMLASKILGKDVRKVSPTMGVFKNNKVVIVTRTTPRVTSNGTHIRHYIFSEQWHWYYQKKFLESPPKEEAKSDGVAVHVEQ